MSHPEEDVTGFLVALLEESFESFRQRFIARLVALHNLVAVLVDNQQVIIFVNDFHRVAVLWCKDTAFF
jgi:hypothetical protein